MSLKLPSRLLRGLDKEQKENFKALYQQSAFVLRRVAQVVQEDYAQALKHSENVDRFDLPNWSEYQADNVGFRRSCNKVLALLPDPNIIYEEDE